MVCMIQKERMQTLLDQVMDLDHRAEKERKSVEDYQIEAERAYRKKIHQLEIDGMHELKKRRDALREQIEEERDAQLLEIEENKRATLARIERLMGGDRTELVDQLIEDIFGSETRG